MELRDRSSSDHIQEDEPETGAEVEINRKESGRGANQDAGEYVGLVGEREETDGSGQHKTEEHQPVVEVARQRDGVQRQEKKETFNIETKTFFSMS